ncbi:hypothetical protein [Polycladidibacter stylochi]|uniref:hypothetical protein n=1 Tax=Polycladidibacter stylochi TaxID=1807766 RepID=UPI00082BA1CD|nr:hypothetical protein [Pseudovibrio stylochi]
MILDFFPIRDESKRADLLKIDELIRSDDFLRGVGVHAQTSSVALDIPLVRDVPKAFDMMTSQEIWDLPEPWPYQYFPGIVEDESGRIQFKAGLDNTERLSISQICSEGMDQFGQYINRCIDDACARHNIEKFLLSAPFEKSTEEDLEWMISSILRNEVVNYLQYMTEAICFVGLKRTPIFTRVYEAFLTGGIPCGWVGAEPEEGGDPIKCIQLLHYGKPMGT